MYTKPTQQDIELLAYKLWDLHGRPNDHSERFWCMAENYLQHKYKLFCKLFHPLVGNLSPESNNIPFENNTTN